MKDEIMQTFRTEMIMSVNTTFLTKIIITQKGTKMCL